MRIGLQWLLHRGLVEVGVAESRVATSLLLGGAPRRISRRHASTSRLEATSLPREGVWRTMVTHPRRGGAGCRRLPSLRPAEAATPRRLNASPLPSVPPLHRPPLRPAGRRCSLAAQPVSRAG